jgi:hypothetical protein
MSLLQHMRQEAKVRKNKRKSVGMLAVHDNQCGFMKMLVDVVK